MDSEKSEESDAPSSTCDPAVAQAGLLVSSSKDHYIIAALNYTECVVIIFIERSVKIQDVYITSALQYMNCNVITFTQLGMNVF